MLVLLLLLLSTIARLLLQIDACSATQARRAYAHPGSLPVAPAFRDQRKPAWVRREIVRFKAWSPDAGCRVIAELFNRRFAEQGARVGKTYVAGVLRASKYDIAVMRRTVKHRIPRPLARNRTWALDLTGKTDLSGHQHVLLGLLDHGTRACLELGILPDKRSLTILGAVLSACRRYGLPTRVRVDNEICLNSKLIRHALALLDIHLQTTEPHCP